MPPKYHAPTGSKSNYSVGIRAENKVASQYRNSGWSVKQSPGSRGAADLKCTKPNHKPQFVQVKTVNNPANTPHISNQEVGRLKSTSTKNHATPVVATVSGSGTVSLTNPKTGNTVKK